MSRSIAVSAIAILIPLVILVSGCGAGPTSPSATGTTTSTTGPNPSPPVDPTTPPPSPPPPQPPSQPTPTPAPTPPPPAPTSTVYHASTTSAHWYGQPGLPDTFDVTVTDSTVTVGPFPAVPITTRSDTTLFAVLEPGPGGLTFQISNSSWSVTGSAGQASGTLSK